MTVSRKHSLPLMVVVALLVAIGFWLAFLVWSVNFVRTIPRALDHTSGTNAPSLHQVLTPPLRVMILLGQLAERDFLIPIRQRQTLMSLTHFLATLETSVLTGQKTWLIIFQNSQELRATGGFMGSLAFVTLNEGSITHIEIQDIYQPDGQFTGYPNPPAGVREYLSGGGNWHLPDLNWSPDFPTSAALIAKYLTLAHQPSIDGIITINLPVAQRILQTTGPIEVPDYQTSVTSDNIAETLRQNRSQFFPGSIAKQHLLSSFFTQFKLKLHQLSIHQAVSLLPLMKDSLETHEVQVVSIEPTLESQLQNLSVTGTLPSARKVDLYLFPVESNVGINKANQGISRTYQANIGLTSSTFTITYSNQNPATNQTDVNTHNPLAESPHLDYVNYQRLLLKPETEVSKIVYNGQTITKVDTEMITTSNGEQLKQVGFLVVVPTQGESQLIVNLTHPDLYPTSRLLIGKQSGIAPVPVDIIAVGHRDHHQTVLTKTWVSSPQDW